MHHKQRAIYTIFVYGAFIDHPKYWKQALV